MGQLTPEQIAALLTGVAGVIAAGATWAVKAQRKEGVKHPQMMSTTLADVLSAVSELRSDVAAGQVENRQLHRDRAEAEATMRVELARLDALTRPWRK
ncbi:hypothetical protein J4E08_24080 [Sagittula sp. NFXS13]|uniref:hypothetical protein n=1 Tax=Sagittula sp. NFXS13 TaxID=2819095 RepID=UPI0032DF41F3